MLASTIESFATQTAIASLKTYQKHLSPRKGFSCPHRLLYGGESCSDYVKRTLLSEQKLSAAIKMAPQRFKACKFAAQTLQTSKAEGGCIVVPCCIPI
ncbi:MAG: membrane protein insertion efficiency factor YidD [Coleofasciculaceae cyanobacterium]